MLLHDSQHAISALWFSWVMSASVENQAATGKKLFFLANVVIELSVKVAASSLLGLLFFFPALLKFLLFSATWKNPWALFANRRKGCHLSNLSANDSSTQPTRQLGICLFGSSGFCSLAFILNTDIFLARWSVGLMIRYEQNQLRSVFIRKCISFQFALEQTKKHLF